MTKPMQEEVKEAIEQLRELKSKVRRRTAFGDDNHAAIDVQIEVLEKDLSEDDIFDAWPGDSDEYERNAALEALAWLDGEEIEYGLVEGWQELAN